MKNNLNILFIELLDKTSAIHLLPILTELSRDKNIRCVLLGQKDTYLAQKAKELHIPTYQIDHVELNIHYVKTYSNFLRTMILIFHIIKKYNIRIVHCHRLNWAYLGIVASFFFKIKLFVDIVYIEKLSSNIQLLLMKIYKNITYLAVSNFARIKFHEVYPYIDLVKIKVFSGGITFPNKDDRSPIYAGLRDWKGKRIIAMVSRLDPAKGVHIFIEAAGFLRDKRKDVNFLFVGFQRNKVWAENYYETCEKHIHNLGLQNRFRILDFTYDMNQIYPYVFCTVLPTFRDTLAYVAIESLVYKKPVIITNIDGTSEAVGDGKAGMLLPFPPSPLLFAASIEKLLINKKLYRKYSNQGYMWVKKYYDINNNIKILRQYYSDLSTFHKITFVRAFFVKP